MISKSCLALIFAAMAFAQAGHGASARAVIQYLTCGGVDARAGATSVVFAGNLGADAYFNISSLGPFGVPFAQQARMVSARATSEGLEFKLQTMITGATLYLTVVNGTNRGLLATSPGDDQDGIALNCTAQISGL